MFRNAYRDELTQAPAFVPKWCTIHTYKTFDRLAYILEHKIKTGSFDVIVQSAAISDYEPSGTYAMNEAGGLEEVDSSTKISSKHPRLYLQLSPTIKLVDQFETWGFSGTLVKFKLQSGMSDEALIEITKRSLKQSNADLIVANCLEWFKERAYVMDAVGHCTSVPRSEIGAAIAAHVNNEVWT